MEAQKHCTKFTSLSAIAASSQYMYNIHCHCAWSGDTPPTKAEQFIVSKELKVYRRHEAEEPALRNM
jgi:hypothetical protein